MDGPEKSRQRRAQVLWLVFVLAQIAAYMLVKLIFDVNIIYYLFGLDLLIGLWRLKKEPIMKARWGFRAALVILAGALCAVPLAYLWHFQHLGESRDMALITPTEAYAQMVGQKLIMNVMNDMNFANGIYIWRNTGRLEEPLAFPKPTLFWFSYNTATGSFTFYRPDTGVSPLPAPPGWEERLKPVIPSLLQEKKEWGWVDHTLQEAGHTYRIRGKIWPDEPRVIAGVNDMDIFYQDAGAVFKRAAQDIPLLEVFTAAPQPEVKNGPPSLMTITLRDNRDSVLAQLGSLGNYKPDKHSRKSEYRKSYPLKNVGLTLEVVIPRCLEKQFNRLTVHFFALFIFIWLGTLLLWAKAETRLSRSKKEQAQKESSNPAA